MNLDRKKDNRYFKLGCALFMAILSIRFYDNEVNIINTTMLAFSYRYGFISRGLIGTIYQTMDTILPINMKSYTAVVAFTKVVTCIFFIVLFIFFSNCLKFARENENRKVQYLIILYSMFAVPFFVTQYNFGRSDLYMLMLSLWGSILLIKERMEWLVIPIAAVATMVHQGYVFMFFNILLVLLLCKCCDSAGTRKKKYIFLLISSFVVASGLFLWFELFSHANGELAYHKVVAMAKTISQDGKTIHTDVIDKEILGTDITSHEVLFHLQNAIQFPVFLVLTMPYIIIGIRFFRNMFREAKGTNGKLKYLAIACGSFTIIPELLLKVDFGRWMFSIVSYYLIVSLSLLGMRDKLFENQLESLMIKLSEKKVLAILLFVYQLVLQPFCDVSICHVTASIAGFVNDSFLHWW